MITAVQPKVFFEGIDIGLDLPIILMDEDFLEYLDEEGVYEDIDISDFKKYFYTWMKENCE